MPQGRQLRLALHKSVREARERVQGWEVGALQPVRAAKSGCACIIKLAAPFLQRSLRKVRLAAATPLAAPVCF